MRDLRQFASYTGERQLELTDVTETRVSTYLDFLSGQGKSPATVSRSLASIKGFYHYLVSKGVMEENPAAHVASVKSEKKLPQVLTGKEVERLLAQPKCTDMKGYRDKAMLELLYATGIRVTELISLNLTVSIWRAALSTARARERSGSFPSILRRRMHWLYTCRISDPR